MRATEFDFRTHLQQIDDSSDCSPHQYQLSPDSSPEMPYQEPMVNSVRFQYPAQEAGAQVFFNSYSDHVAVQPAPNSYTSAAWDSWPAPNVIHLTSSSPAPTPIPGHNISFSNHLAHVTPNTFGHNSSVNHPNTTINVYDVDYNIGLADAASEEVMGLYSSPPSGSALPVELQYCFDHPPQQQVSLGTFSLPDVFNPLLESSGVNVNGANVNVNMGLLNLDLPGFCPLDL